jgi:hypothetical protein
VAADCRRGRGHAKPAGNTDGLLSLKFPDLASSTALHHLDDLCCSFPTVRSIERGANAVQIRLMANTFTRRDAIFATERPVPRPGTAWQFYFCVKKIVH